MDELMDGFVGYSQSLIEAVSFYGLFSDMGHYQRIVDSRLDAFFPLMSLGVCNIENGIALVLGKPLEEAEREWLPWVEALRWQGR